MGDVTAAAFAVERTRDLALADALEREQGWRREPRELPRRFQVEPDGHFVARTAAGEVAGSASCVVHGTLAWIAAVVVRPAHRRQGVARGLLGACLAHAAARGASVVGLDAAPEAVPLYEQAGFVPVARTAWWTRPPWGARPTPVAREFALYPVSACELMDLARYDAPRFGANRMPWLAAVLADFPERGFVVFRKAGGDLAGFALGQGTYLGPLVAEAPEAALLLLHAAEATGTPPRVVLTGLNRRAAAVLHAAGYRPEGLVNVRMVRGGTLPGRAETLYAASGWSVG